MLRVRAPVFIAVYVRVELMYIHYMPNGKSFSAHMCDRFRCEKNSCRTLELLINYYTLMSVCGGDGVNILCKFVTFFSNNSMTFVCHDLNFFLWNCNECELNMPVDDK